MMENLMRHRLVASNFSILLRVPLIFLLDFISASKYCCSVDGWRILMMIVNFSFYIPIYLQSRSNHLLLPNFEVIFHFILQMTGFAVIFFLLIQSTYCLLIIYLSVAAVGLIIWSYILNLEFVKYCSELLSAHSSLQYEIFIFNKNALKVFFYYYVLQTFLAIVFCFSTMNLPYFPSKKYMVGILFIFPTLITAVIPVTILTISPDLIAFVTFLVFLIYFTAFLKSISVHLWTYATTHNFSLKFVQILNVIMFNWNEFQFTQVLRAYACFRFVKILIILHYDYISTDFSLIPMFDISYIQALHFFKLINVASCDNIVAICGTSSVLSLIVDKLLYNPMQIFLSVPDNEHSKISPIFSILFVLYCIQFGVAQLEPEQRYRMITNIYYVMGITVISQLNLQVCKKLVSLCVHEQFAFKKHSKVLFLSLVMLTVSIVYLTPMFKYYLPEPWLFSVTLFNIENVISLVISLFIYILNLIHFYCYSEWYELYDYIYYLEALKSIVTLFLSILLLIKGFYNLFDIGSTLRLLLLFVHFYYNVWCKLVLGWNCWKERKKICSCVNSLPVASKEEISEMGGCCAICLCSVDKNTTCITRCNHFFHCYCLRKWLCEQKTCPICHRIILIEN